MFDEPEFEDEDVAMGLTSDAIDDLNEEEEEETEEEEEELE